MKSGENIVDGVPVCVVRKKVRRISIGVKPDGLVHLTVPAWGATLAQGEAFMRSKWDWVLRTRARILAHPALPAREFTPEELAGLQTLLGELHDSWAARLGRPGVSWKLSAMKTRWGACNWAKRRITYAAMLADRPRELVEYIVVHEFTHFDVHGHGPQFRAFMDARLPDWRVRRRLLDGRPARR